jgi:hypothetical protein
VKEAEFTKSSDKQNWMDTSVLSDKPRKVTIIDPRPYVMAMMDILDSLEAVKDENLTNRQLEHLAKSSIRTIMSAIIAGRRAWVYGIDADVILSIVELKKIFGFDIDARLRDNIRYELDFDLDPRVIDLIDKKAYTEESKKAAVRIVSLLKEIADLMKNIMNKNQFVLHDLTNSKDGRVFWLEEYDDWRVIQWTKDEQAKIDARHEDI